MFGVITKRHTWQLITNPVSNKEVSVSQPAPETYHFKYWSMRQNHPLQIIRDTNLDDKNTTGTSPQCRQMLLLILSEVLLSDCGLLWSWVQMVQGTKSQLERSALLFVSHFFERDVTGARKQVVLKIAIIHQIAEAEVRSIFSKFSLCHMLTMMLTWLCHFNNYSDLFKKIAIDTRNSSL